MTATTTDETAVSVAGHFNLAAGAETTTLPPSPPYKSALGNASNQGKLPQSSAKEKQAIESEQKDVDFEKSELVVEEVSSVEENESGYPPFWKVVLLTIGINFALFLVALVRLNSILMVTLVYVWLIIRL